MKKIVSILLLVVSTQLFTACEKWFDVNPRSQVKGDDLFENENGFKTALFGVYTSMNQPKLYGENLTMSFLDVLAQYYPIDLPSHSYFQASAYEYDSQSVKDRTNGIWRELYRTIMNCNNILENIKAKPELFTYQNSDLMEGELYGLRAYLHFDLLRMFAPSYAEGAATAAAIPYVDKVARSPFPQLRTEQVVAKIIADCEHALNCLKGSDPFGPAGNRVMREDKFLEYRYERMNYYAVMALLARVQLWSGNREAAKQITDEMIENVQFNTNSIIFSLYSDKLQKYSDNYFSAESPTETRLLLSESKRDVIYETNQYKSYDQRILTWLELDPNSVESADGSNTGRFLITKYTKGVVKPVNIPLIKMNEIYYINAECQEDQTRAIARLNEVRMAYGIPESLNLVAEKCIFEDELQKEYRKSFLSEGHFFYFLKRRDCKVIPDAVGITDARSVYTLPLPELEIEFGNLIQEPLNTTNL